MRKHVMLPLVLIAAKTKTTPFPALLSIVIIIIAATILLINIQLETNYASAQTVNEEEKDFDIPGDLIPTGPVGPVGIVNELQQAHSDITGIMIDHSNDNYSVADEFVFTMTYVDEVNEELIVILDPILLSLGLQYDPSDIAGLLGNDQIKIRVSYGVFIPESHVDPSSQSQIDSWISLYNSRCSSPADNALCEALAFNLGTQNHHTLDDNNMWQPPSNSTVPEPEPIPTPVPEPTPTPTPEPTPNMPPRVFFFDDFEDSTLNKWTKSGEPDWRADTFDEGRLPPNHTSTNKVAEADNCDTQCTITLANPVDLSSAINSTLQFYRYIDRSLDNTEYLKIEVTTDGESWTQLDKWSPENGDDDDKWYLENYNITSYNSDAFSIRYTAHMNSAGEEVGIDDVKIISTSATPIVREFYGGDLVQLRQIAEIGGNVDMINGTITIGATKTNGNVGFVTAGHNLQVKAGANMEGIFVGPDLLLANSTDPQVVLGQHVDVSFLPITEYDSFTVSTNQIKKLDGTIIDVSTNSTNILVPNLRVDIFGIHTNAQGSVTVTNATTTRNSDIVLTNTSISNYDSIYGDSGAPIVATVDGVNHLVGVHMGYICEFTNYADGRSFTVDLTPGSTQCDPSDTPYKIFSSWENTRTALQLR